MSLGASKTYKLLTPAPVGQQFYHGYIRIVRNNEPLTEAKFLDNIAAEFKQLWGENFRKAVNYNLSVFHYDREYAESNRHPVSGFCYKHVPHIHFVGKFYKGKVEIFYTNSSR